MQKITYLVKDEDIRKPEAATKVIEDLFKGKDPKDCTFVVDYSQVRDPVVTMSTGIIFQRFCNQGFPKVIIKGHKYKDKLLENPAVKSLIASGKIEVIS
jgi:hypothetical protein